MGDYRKRVKQGKEPKGNHINQKGNPNQYYLLRPAWNFSGCDKEKWSLLAEKVREIFWKEIFPRFQCLETQTWNEILIDAKKQNHSIEVTDLNKAAIDRLMELCVEAESLLSLRVTATHRIYGYMKGGVFNILWVDLDHGDNLTCVCRARKKRT